MLLYVLAHLPTSPSRQTVSRFQRKSNAFIWASSVCALKHQKVNHGLTVSSSSRVLNCRRVLLSHRDCDRASIFMKCNTTDILTFCRNLVYLYCFLKRCQNKTILTRHERCVQGLLLCGFSSACLEHSCIQFYKQMGLTVGFNSVKIKSNQ